MNITATKTLKYIVAYREAVEYSQREAEFFTKEAANRFAMQIDINGGVSVIIEDLVDDLQPRSNKDELNFDEN